MTEWRRVQMVLYRNYEVSDEGAVRRGARELAGYVDRYGYRTVQLSYAGLPKRFKVHRLVCEAFSGPSPAGYDCAHIDGDRLNNRADNLAWVTRSENNKHQYLHGRPVSPNLTCGRPQLPEVTRKAVIADAIAGMGGRRLARKHGISRSTAYAIQREAETPND